MSKTCSPKVTAPKAGLKQRLLALVDRRTIVALTAITMLFVVAVRETGREPVAAIDGIVWCTIALAASNAGQKSLTTFARHRNKARQPAKRSDILKPDAPE